MRSTTTRRTTQAGRSAVLGAIPRGLTRGDRTSRSPGGLNAGNNNTQRLHLSSIQVYFPVMPTVSAATP